MKEIHEISYNPKEPKTYVKVIPHIETTVDIQYNKNLNYEIIGIIFSLFSIVSGIIICKALSDGGHILLGIFFGVILFMLGIEIEYLFKHKALKNINK